MQSWIGTWPLFSRFSRWNSLLSMAQQCQSNHNDTNGNKEWSVQRKTNRGKSESSCRASIVFETNHSSVPFWWNIVSQRTLCFIKLTAAAQNLTVRLSLSLRTAIISKEKNRRETNWGHWQCPQSNRYGKGPRKSYLSWKERGEERRICGLLMYSNELSAVATDSSTSGRPVRFRHLNRGENKLKAPLMFLQQLSVNCRNVLSISFQKLKKHTRPVSHEKKRETRPYQNRRYTDVQHCTDLIETIELLAVAYKSNRIEPRFLLKFMPPRAAP